MASKQVLWIVGGLVTAGALAGGLYAYNLKKAADALSVNTAVRVHKIDAENLELSIDIDFINASQNSLSFTYPALRIYKKAEQQEQIGFSVPKPEKITVAKSSIATIRDMRLRIATSQVVGMGAGLLTNIFTGQKLAIDLLLVINLRVGLFDTVLKDEVSIDLSKHLSFLKGLFGKSNATTNTKTSGLALGCACDAQKDTLVMTNSTTLIGVLADDHTSLVPFEVSSGTIIGKNPKTFDRNPNHTRFTTLQGTEAIGVTNQLLMLNT